MDLFLLYAVQNIHTPFWDAFFIAMTRLGEDIFYLPLLAGLYWCYRRETGVRVAVVFLFSAVFNGVLKGLVNRARPIGWPHVRTLYAQTATGTSFPSGHSQNAAAFWRVVAQNIPVPIVGILGMVVVLLIGVSRVYLGVHWPSDVIGGIIAGLLVSEGYAYLEPRLSGAMKTIAFCIIAGILQLMCLWRPEHQYLAPGGLLAGALFGVLWERRIVRFAAKTDIKRQAAKLALGLGVLLLLRFGLKRVLPEGWEIGVYLRYMILGLWLTGGAPWVFVRLKLTPKEADLDFYPLSCKHRFLREKDSRSLALPGE